MGEIYRYHITMLVTLEQEDSIREMFKHRDWPCLINAVKEENVSDIIQSGFTDVFPVLTNGEGGNDGNSAFREIKTEIVNEDNDVDTPDMPINLKVTKRKQVSASNLDISNDDCIVSDNQTHLSDNNLQYSDNTPEMSDNEGAGTCTDNDHDVASSNSSCSDEESGKHKMKSADKREDSSKEVYSSKTRSKKGNLKQKKTKFRCSICDMYLASKPSLLRHCQRRHQDEWFEFKCKDCSCMFKKVEELWQHRNEVKHEPPKVQPKFSEKKNLSPEELEQLGHLKCNACGKILPSRRLLRRHFYSDHREWMPDPTCAVCGAEFKTRQELWKHKREMKHNDSLTLLQTYQCEECGKILTGGYHSFKLHQKYACKEEGMEPQAKCDICGSMFKSQTHVQQHKQRTHVEAPVVCDICGTMCKNKHALNSHKRRHDEKNKKFVCDECGKAFLTGLLLKMHVRTHTKEKPFKCPLCNYRCAIKQNIQKHSVNVHKTQVKCSDIVTIKETSVSESMNKTSMLDDSVFVRNSGLSDVTADSSRETDNLSSRESYSKEAVLPSYENLSPLERQAFPSHDTAALSNDRPSMTDDRGLITNDRTSMTDDRGLITNDRTSMTDDRGLITNDRTSMTDDRGLITNDSVLLSHERKRQISNSESHLNSQGTGSQFPIMESAYNLTMCRQSDQSASNRTQKVPENFSAHVSSNNVSSSGSYVEMMNCGLNPLSYTHASIDPSQYPYPWGNTTTR